MTVLPITDFGRPRRLWQPVIEARQWMRIIGGSVFLFGVAASAWVMAGLVFGWSSGPVANSACERGASRCEDLPRRRTRVMKMDTRVGIAMGGVVRAILVLALALAAAPAWAQAARSLAPAGWDSGLKLKESADKNPEPNLVEIDLVAKVAEVEVAPGLKVNAWTYDGGLPGPLIRAKVGDRLVVHFTNQLKEPTTIHWHGVRVPIEMDGVPNISQPEVKTGETFTYDFVVRDPGLFWYHPHVMSAAQVGFGLYGPLQVDDPGDGVGIADELTLVLSDIGFDKRGELEAADSGGPAGQVFGREGQYVLVNGHRRPTIKARAGAWQRWRIVNTAKSRFFLLDMDGQTFTTIGTDGGLQEHPTEDSTVLITAGERLDVLVRPTGKPGSSLVVRAMLYNRGSGSVQYRDVEDLLVVEFTNDPPVKPQPLPAIARRIVAPSAEGATHVPVVLTLPPAGQDGKSEFRVNGVPYWQAKPFQAKLGETQIWEIKNDTEWDHPFHLHGYFFLPLDEHDEPLKPMAWKDTLNIAMKTTVRFLVVFDERPGEWMFHCHILDHAEGGLMGTVLVGDVVPTEHAHGKRSGR
jgi:FtsP/CotA-like multicopper oxidase with cupredoxin domain